MWLVQRKSLCMGRGMSLRILTGMKCLVPHDHWRPWRKVLVLQLRFFNPISTRRHKRRNRRAIKSQRPRPKLPVPSSRSQPRRCIQSDANQTSSICQEQEQKTDIVSSKQMRRWQLPRTCAKNDMQGEPREPNPRPRFSSDGEQFLWLHGHLHRFKP